MILILPKSYQICTNPNTLPKFRLNLPNAAFAHASLTMGIERKAYI